MSLSAETPFTSIKQKKPHSRTPIHQRLPCPACHFDRLIDTGLCTHSLTYVEGQDGYQDADYYQKCKNCKAEVGIRKIE